MQQGMISNGAYVIKRLKVMYPSFRNHVDKLERDEKRYLLEEYDKAFNALPLREVTDRVSRAIQASGTRLPSIADIKEARAPNSVAVQKELPVAMKERHAQEHVALMEAFTKTQKGTSEAKAAWQEFNKMRMRHSQEELRYANGY